MIQRVVAVNYTSYLSYCHDLKLRPRIDATYVSNAEQIMGLNGETNELVVLPDSPAALPGYDRIVQIAQARGMRITHAGRG